MTPTAFIAALFQIVSKGSIPGLIESIRNPPGRRPPVWLVDLSAWYVALDEAGKRNAEELAQRSADAAIRSLLGMLDGSTTFDDENPSSKLQLRHVLDGHATILNNPDELLLDDEYMWQRDN